MKTHRDYVRPGEIVAARRQELALTQTDLARKLGYKNVNFISMVESVDKDGHAKAELPLDKAIDFADVLEMDQRWFAERVLRHRHPRLADAIFGEPRATKKVA